jgi:hypothetical protein
MREVKIRIATFMENVSVNVEATFPIRSAESAMKSIQPHIDAIAAIVADAPISPLQANPQAPSSPSE